MRTHKQSTHKHTWRGVVFLPQITMQVDFFVIRNIECWGMAQWIRLLLPKSESRHHVKKPGRCGCHL